MSSERNSKAIRLIEYLGELAKLRSKLVRDIQTYEKVLWAHEIPMEPKYCYTKVWGIQDEIEDDIWIEIRKYQEPQLPSVPDICAKWVNHDALSNIDNLPELYQTTVEQVCSRSHYLTGLLSDYFSRFVWSRRVRRTRRLVLRQVGTTWWR